MRLRIVWGFFPTDFKGNNIDDLDEIIRDIQVTDINGCVRFGCGFIKGPLALKNPINFGADAN